MMAPKAHPTTMRLTEDDQTFLASLQVAGATTISDKVRALIADRRLIDEAGRDYESALALANNLLAPVQSSIKVAEKEQRVHSQLVHRVMEWAPELLATLLADGPSGSSSRANLKALEQSLAEQLTRLVDIVLQVSMVRDTALYSADALSPEHLTSVRQLCRLMEFQNNNSDHKSGQPSQR
jgi:hypothetical protein